MAGSGKEMATTAGAAASGPGAGSAMGTIDAPRTADAFATAGETVAGGMAGWKADILLVDDEARNLLALKALLEPLGQNLLTAQSGEDALRLVLGHNPAVIVLDVRMPGMDGFETARMIRGRERSRHIPIIFLTGVSREMDSAFRGYEVGAVDYLMKPVVPEVLRSKVSVFVDLHRKNAALASEIIERRAAEERLRKSEAQLRALAARQITIREEERSRIAREIHDELGQVLTGLKMDVMWLVRHLDPDQKPLLEKTDTMRQLIDSTMQLVRRISTGMRPEILDDMGLVAAIGWQAREFQKRMGIRCRVELPEEQIEIGAAVSTAVFRIFQELLTNISRHAKASSVSVQLNVSRELLTLKVVDDGIGIAEGAMQARESLGLLGMQERAQFFGGEISIHGTPSHGTTVSLRIPMTPSGSEPGAAGAGGPGTEREPDIARSGT
jgi:signal transduction histidine kinase